MARLKTTKHILTVGNEKYSLKVPDIYSDFKTIVGVEKAPSPDTTVYTDKLNKDDFSNGKAIRILELLERFRTKMMVNAQESGFTGKNLLALQIAVTVFAQQLLLDLSKMPVTAPVTPPSNTLSQAALLAAIDRSIENGFQSVVDEIAKLGETIVDLAAPPKQRAQEVIANGSLTIPYGSIALTNDGQNNIVWIDKQGYSQLDQGTTREMFTVGASVYIMGSDGVPYTISSDKVSGWDSLPIRTYNDLKAQALQIVTANPVSVQA